MIEDCAEDIYWKSYNDPDELWALDKLILSRKLGYICGPAGIDVPKPGSYIVRPCVNAMGLGLGAQEMWLEELTTHLPYGSFWCEWFIGRHYSVDYYYGEPRLVVEGIRPHDNLVKWTCWKKTDHYIPFPKILEQYKNKPVINCEFIDNKLIEVHFRENEDFKDGISEFRPVWKGQDTTPPPGYSYRECADLHGRIGAFVK